MQHLPESSAATRPGARISATRMSSPATSAFKAAPLSTVLPGTTVKFDSAKVLAVQGVLVARGTAALPITFTSNSLTPAKGDWGYIHFAPSSVDATFDGVRTDIGGCVLQYAIIEYAGGSSVSSNGALRIENSSPWIDHTTIRDSESHAIQLWSGATPRIANNTIVNNAGDGIEAHEPYGQLLLIENAITSSGGDGIDLSNSGSPEATIRGNSITGNSGRGIYAVNGPVTISRNVITGNSDGGIENCCGKIVTINENTIANNIGNGIDVSYINDLATISQNDINGNTGAGIGISNISSPLRINGNSIGDNANSGVHITYFNSIVSISGNALAHNSAPSGGGIFVIGGQPTISGNSITGNTATQAHRGGGIYLGSGSGAVINDNNLYGNLTGNPANVLNDLYNGNSYSSSDINAENNWWGTTDAGVIEDHIWHFMDDAGLGMVDYVPFRTALYVSPTPTATPRPRRPAHPQPRQAGPLRQQPRRPQRRRIRRRPRAPTPRPHAHVDAGTASGL